MDMHFSPDYEVFDFENYTDYNETTDCDAEAASTRRLSAILLPAFYGLLLIVGVAGNGLMVAVIWRRRPGATEAFLLHLAASDLLLLATLPFDLLEQAFGWVLGGALCILTGVAREISLFAGSFLLAAIGLDRYLAVVHAVPSLGRRRPRAVHLACLGLWLTALLMALPNAAFLAVGTGNASKSVARELSLFAGSFLLAAIGGRSAKALPLLMAIGLDRYLAVVHLACLGLWLTALLMALPNAAFLAVGTGNASKNGSPPECDLFRFGRLAHDWLLARRLLHHVCFFSCLAAMLFCYSALAVHLSGGRHRRRAGAVRLAFLLTAAFLVCWLPHHLALLLRTLQELGILPQWGCPQLSRLARALGATHILGLAHCGLNPALYAFLGGRFRRELLGLLGRIWGVRRASTSATRTSHSTLR
ncbi:C-X-C chemokine receptor type 5 [Menidia menidia]